MYKILHLILSLAGGVAEYRLSLLAAADGYHGEIVATAQEGRFTRKKHDSCFPGKAIQ